MSHTPSLAHEHYLAAQAAFDDQDAQQAYRLLQIAFETDIAYRPLYQLAARLFAHSNLPHCADLFDEALKDFENDTVFFRLGYDLVGAGQFRLAVPFLEHALALYPRAATALELSLALTATFQIEKSLQVLEPYLKTEKNSFWFIYQYHYCSLLFAFQNQNPLEIRTWIEHAKTSGILQRYAESEDATIREYALTSLEEMLNRFEAVAQQGAPAPHIRDWHFIQYGAAILNFLDETQQEEELAAGRFVHLWESKDTVELTLAKLKRFLAKIYRQGETEEDFFKVVIGLSDRNSEILGMAIAKMLALPYLSEKDIALDTEYALVVGSESTFFNNYPELSTIKKNQVLFAYHQSWFDETTNQPDIVGHISQFYSFPWQGEGYLFNPETKNLEAAPKDERPAHLIAQELAKTNKGLWLPDSFYKNLQFYQTHKAFLKGGMQDLRPLRLHYKTDSPLAGNALM
ncbi:tetratricopeptide repeat protein [Hugenholtzia roseola]|uniref:tetratricopeptide repeat protein n=1 Tax=Hugenholtzia roseola TaxID=1002 RepID=UPI0004021E51|nr:hypothetical protein [Hugenholtzia roseola]